MVFLIYPYHIVTFVLVVFSFIIFSFVFRQRDKTGAKYSLGLLGLVILWLVAQGLEFSVQGLKDKLIFANIQYIPITMIPVLFFFLALTFSGREFLLKKNIKNVVLLLFLIMPLTLNVLIWTDSFHGLIRQNVRLVATGLVPTVGKEFGPVMLPFALYNFLLTALTLAVMASAWLDKVSHFREQAKYLFVGLLVPAVATLLHYVGINYENIDMTPASFAITEAFLAFGIYRHGLFDIVPIALTHIFNEMKPGLIVYDKSLRVIDINPAAQKILEIDGRQITGQKVSVVFAHIPELVQVMEKQCVCKEEISYRNKTQGHYEVTASQLKNVKGTKLGWMVEIYDITERKGAEDQLRMDKENAESGFLQAQIKPHFLYNALNIIAVICRVEPEKARDLILDLSNYMRHSFDYKGLEKYTTFEEELSFIQAYVRIEQARFKGSLNMIYDIEDAGGLRLPPLLLQPLVENAIRHGIRKSKSGRTVILKVRREGQQYMIEVEDDGVGMSPDQLDAILQKSETDGVGLSNIQKRLKMLYGTELMVESHPSQGTKVTMFLPVR